MNFPFGINKVDYTYFKWKDEAGFNLLVLTNRSSFILILKKMLDIKTVPSLYVMIAQFLFIFVYPFPSVFYAHDENDVTA
jgi:hypothetical protein